MHLQYLSDYSGKPTAVVIPIADWKAMLSKYADLQSLNSATDNNSLATKEYTMADFMGTISTKTANALSNHVEQSRNEWDRNS